MDNKTKPPEKPAPVLARVRAKRHVSEQNAEGVVKHYEPGEVFDLDPTRAKALGPLVEDAKGAELSVPKKK